MKQFAAPSGSKSLATYGTAALFYGRGEGHSGRIRPCPSAARESRDKLSLPSTMKSLTLPSTLE